MSGWNELAGLVTVEPLTSPLPAPTYNGWSTSPFKASDSQTRALFAKEVKELKAKKIVIEASFRSGQIRQDGLPRGDARPTGPGIVVRLIGTPYGDLRYEGTVFRDWQSNLRAIALSLEALRKVDRYGVTKRGEQYKGWAQLSSGAGDGNAERGRQLIAEAGSVAAALKAAHPDHGGSDDDFRDVQAAR